jgi:arylsulfatase A-like enzyme
MYDAEVAYQDHLLAELLSAVDTDYHRENTMVIFLADHGEMLGEHGYMGHGFGMHEELIRVPLFMRVPGMSKGKHITQRVSITQVFHTILDYFGFESISMPYANEVDIQSQSLIKVLSYNYNLPKNIISEAYSPENAIQIMHRHAPELIEKYHADHIHRAVYQGDIKMIAIDGLMQVLYNLAEDPDESSPFIDDQRIEELSRSLETYLELSASRRSCTTKQKASLTDELIQQRLRDLGYLE